MAATSGLSLRTIPTIPRGKRKWNRGLGLERDYMLYPLGLEMKREKDKKVIPDPIDDRKFQEPKVSSLKGIHVAVPVNRLSVKDS